MKLIVGLGNPGDKYKFTRHNAGFIALDYFALNSTFGGFDFRFESKFNGEIAKINYEGDSIIFLKPHTFMNLSGESIQAVMNFYKIERKDLLVIYDDIALPTGALRFRAKGSDGGHNGIKSIIRHLGGNNNFDRLKVGIGPQPALPSEVYVLQNFTEDQLKEIKSTLKTAEEAVESYLKDGLVLAQSKFNG